MFRSQPIDDDARIITELFNCNDRVTDEVLHYARVLAARGLSEDYITLAVTNYAKVRTSYDGL